MASLEAQQSRICLQCRRHGQMWVCSLSQEDALEKKWQPNPVFLPGESHGQRSLAGHSPRGRKKVRHDWSNWACIYSVLKNIKGIVFIVQNLNVIGPSVETCFHEGALHSFHPAWFISHEIIIFPFLLFIQRFLSSLFCANKIHFHVMSIWFNIEWK